MRHFSDDYKDKDSIIRKDTTKFTNIPAQDIEDAMTLSSGAFRLLIYLFSKSGTWKFNKATIKKVCKLTDRGYADARRELIRTGWYEEEKDGAIKIFLIGKRTVSEFREHLKTNRHNAKVYSDAQKNKGER